MTEFSAAGEAMPDPRSHGFFFDFDGTLAEIAPRAEDVVLEPALCADLRRLWQRSGGAVAALSGRRRADLARYLPQGIALAGLHGLEIEGDTDDLAARAAELAAELDGTRANLARVAARHPGARLEDKGPALALHWRLAPQAEPELAAAAAAAVAALGPGWTLQPGKCVVEIRPRGRDKGDALRRLMARPPFRGRRPLAFGDDLTDIPMLRAAQRAGGLAVAIGERDLPCDLRLAGPAELALWIRRSLA